LVLPSFAVQFEEATHLQQVNAAVSCYHGAGFLAVFLSSYVSNRWGRKASYLVNSFFYLLGNSLNAGSQNLGMFIAGRFFSGWGAYGLLYSSQIYVMEQAPAKARGLLATCANGIAMEVGYIIGSWAAVGYLDWETNTGSSWSWRFPFLLNMVPILILLAGYPFMPESPRWLVSKGRPDEALEVLKTLHATSGDPTHSFAIAEHTQIFQQYALDQTLPSSWISMFTTYRKRTFTAILILFGFLLAGCYFLATYGPQLFGAFGYSTRKSLIYEAATLMMLVVNWVGCPLIDVIGRKPFLVIGLSGELICLVCLCVLSKFYGDGKNEAGANAFVGIYIFNEVVTAITEPCAYLMATELFPLHVRNKGVAISFGFLALTNFWVLESASTMVQNLGWKAYFLFIAFSTVNVVLFIIILPETKNVPLEEMAILFGERDQVVGGASHRAMNDSGSGEKRPEDRIENASL